MKSTINLIKPVCILLVFISGCIPVFSQTQEKTIAKSYLKEAEHLFELKKYSQALSMANKGLEFSREPKLFFIAAKSLFILNADGKIAREYAREAVDLSNTSSFDEREEFLVLYYKILYRQKEYNFIVSEITKLIEKNENISPELYRIYISSLKRLNKTEKLNDVLPVVLSIFPDDAWFYIFSGLYSSVPISELFDYATISTEDLAQLIGMFFYDDSFDLIPVSIFHSLDISESNSLISAFSLLADSMDTKKWNIFLQQGGYRQRELMLALYQNKAIDIDRIKQAYDFFDATDHMTWDTNMDMFPEYKIDINNSGIATMIYDENQDNRPELVINYEHAYPSDMYVYADEQIWKIVYDPYPAVVSVELISQSKHVEYKLIPLSLEIPINGIPVQSENWVLSPWGGNVPSFVIPVSDILNHTLEINVYDSKQPNKAYVNIRMSGNKINMLRARLLDGDSWDMMVWYKDGYPEYGKRDLDGNGFFEIQDTYDVDGNVTKSSYNGLDNNYSLVYDYKDSSFLWVFKEGEKVKKLVTEDKWGGAIVFNELLKELYR
ncbi:tetratricopeptide repeat protein [Spirochaetia bacterium 38H-sp]|uniref:Tetratricopeptide repeat protein n=1 Tax=Rarispira pelagica TaxID=3141764 RepID=A0ABU9UE15_9SPIR